MDKINESGGRATVLMSHHPLFSAYEGIGHEAVNGKLQDTFGEVLPMIAFWFWGHEHRLDIYAPYLGLERGRCLGASAIPVVTEGAFFKPKYADVPLLQNPAGSGNAINLGTHNDIYNYAYAIMKLNGPAATVSYYQFDDDQSSLFFSEKYAPPAP